jgi:hypothetical protein
MYLAKKNDAMGIERTSWESSNGNDHLVHSQIYQQIALIKTREGQGGLLTNEPKNYKEYAPVIDAEGNIQDETTSLEWILLNQDSIGKDWSDY